ncbi:hypothetical protein B0T22DRAFT_44027 [Podospora appendiculata]|uniref:Uncharacterized protein n=1 Tax=Podospora appendiculata TaxID=314037 RepID=A0AAE0XHZ5_9PEZI|nr:hypothetical protein B0T22DRAFT_44027 [Podospora appendiculata]
MENTLLRSELPLSLIAVAVATEVMSRSDGVSSNVGLRSLLVCYLFCCEGGWVTHRLCRSLPVRICKNRSQEQVLWGVGVSNADPAFPVAGL